jgi:carboxypeptidase PM20D1
MANKAVILIPVLLLLFILISNTFFATSRIKERTIKLVEPLKLDIDKDLALQKFAKGITFKTVSHHNTTDFQRNEFDAFVAYLETSYPIVFKSLERETLDCHTIILKWQGTDKSLKPVLLVHNF